MKNQISCLACRHEIDASARICPYCGADPRTGQKAVDTSALLEEMFKPRQISASESVLEYARHRQGIVIAISGFVLFLVLTALHQYVTMRNQRSVSAAPAVPLTEVADVANQPDATKPQPMPDLGFSYEGRPEAMRSPVIEPGAVTPPEVLAAQQAAARAAAEKQQAVKAPAPPASGARPPAQPPGRPPQ